MGQAFDLCFPFQSGGLAGSVFPVHKSHRKFSSKTSAPFAARVNGHPFGDVQRNAGIKRVIGASKDINEPSGLAHFSRNPEYRSPEGLNFPRDFHNEASRKRVLRSARRSPIAV